MQHQREMMMSDRIVLSNRVKSVVKLGCILSTMAGFTTIIFALYGSYTLLIPTFLSTPFLVLPGIALILIGILSPIFAAIGWHGANKGSMREIKVCYSLMSISIILSVSLSAYVCIETTSGNESARALYRGIVYYQEDRRAASYINAVQTNFGCCGIKGIDDWNKNEYFTCEVDNPNPVRCNVPSSCCIELENYNKPYGCGRNGLNITKFRKVPRQSVLHVIGCQNKIDYQLMTAVLDMELIMIFITVCQVFILKTMAYIICVYKRRRPEINNDAEITDIAEDTV